VSDIGARFREFVSLDRRRAQEGLSPAELSRWAALKRYLGRELAPGLSDERADERGSLRVPARMRVSFASLGQLGHCLMTNLSRGGLFVATDHLLAIGTRVLLRLHVEHEARTLEVPAEVVSQNVGPAAAQQRGIGLRFLDVDPPVRKELDALYERALAAAALPTGKKSTT
jgi:uncharacterized protein (TIGR02266 family)